MKNNKGKLLLLVTSLIAISLIVIGSKAWDKKVGQSTIVATEQLENDGVSINTIDLDKFKKGGQKPSDDNQSEQDPRNHSKNVNENESETDNGNNSPNNNSSTPSQTGNTGGNGSPSSNEDSPLPINELDLLTQIKRDYMDEFLRLENEISVSLNDILDRAVEDIKDKKENNQKVNIVDFQLKYVKSARQLEEYSDQQFNNIYKKLEAELEENGFSINEAAPFRAQYQAEKRNREEKAVARISSLK